MPSRVMTYVLLFAAWFATSLAAGFAGAFVAIRARSSAIRPDYLALQGLQIVGDDGKPHITLGTLHNEPVLRLDSAAGNEALRFDVTQSERKEWRAPHLQVFDPNGNSAIELVGSRGPQGLLTFSSVDRVEGKLMLGHFGITDDESDTGMWGLQVSGRTKGGHEEKSLGVTTSKGQDQSFIWPLYPKSSAVN